jgi:hypothetical protein
MDVFSTGLAVLTAMIAPAVLISACGTLIFSTSTRLGRVVDRVRDLSDKFEKLARDEVKDELERNRLKMIFGQLDALTSRARLLQRTMTAFYVSLCIFVGTSVAIGIVSITKKSYTWFPVVLGLVGACFLFYGCFLLILEARLALGSTYKEMDFLWAMGQRYAPAEIVENRKNRKP